MLAQLEKRRMELEGDKADVDRCTEVSYPESKIISL